MTPCATCGRPARKETCRRCRAAADRAERRAELDAVPMPTYNTVRVGDEAAEAAARVAELREAEGDVERLSAAATESLRRHLDRRGTSPL